MRSAAGTFGNPGMVMMLPQMTTTNSSPWAGRTSRMGRTWPEGAPFRLGSAEKDVNLRMQTGKWLYPSLSCANWRRALMSAVMSAAP